MVSEYLAPFREKFWGKFERFSVVTAASGFSGNGCVAKTRFWGQIWAFSGENGLPGGLSAPGKRALLSRAREGPFWSFSGKFG